MAARDRHCPSVVILAEQRSVHVLALIDHSHVAPLPREQLAHHALGMLATSRRIGEIVARDWVCAAAYALAAEVTVERIAEATGHTRAEIVEAVRARTAELVGEQRMAEAERDAILAQIGWPR